MILYLSRSESANLLDEAAEALAVSVSKVSGNLCLSEFIIRDMRKYASCQFFCVERLALTETDKEFLEALQSFQMMYKARIIVIKESTRETDSLVRGLAQIGVTDIVTAPDMAEKLIQINECLSENGMLRYKPHAVRAAAVADLENQDETPDTVERKTPMPPLPQSVILSQTEDEHYRFDCVNVKIGVIGATRRVGTTTAALGLVNFIQNHGGTACYVAENTNRHLDCIANSYNFDTEDDYFTLESIDFYEQMPPKYEYNFIVYDFGDMNRDAIKKFKECDERIVCGASNKLHEVLELAEAMKLVKSVKPLVFTYIPNPEHGQIFSSTVTMKPSIIRQVKSMMDYRTNGLVFKDVVGKYIVEMSKRF